MVNKKKPAAPAAETRAINARGEEYKAEQLTGNRAQKGNLRGGAPCWVYEVKWSGGFKNTYEPASCLVGWEKEMTKVGEKCAIRGLLPTVSPAAEAAKAREAAAKLKAEAMQKRRARLQRLQARRVHMGCEDVEESRCCSAPRRSRDGGTGRRPGPVILLGTVGTLSIEHRLKPSGWWYVTIRAFKR